MSVLTSLWLFMSRVVVSPHKELNEGISPTNSQKDTSQTTMFVPEAQKITQR